MIAHLSVPNHRRHWIFLKAPSTDKAHIQQVVLLETHMMFLITYRFTDFFQYAHDLNISGGNFTSVTNPVVYDPVVREQCVSFSFSFRVDYLCLIFRS
jgi:hypothetical protein